MRIIVIGGGNHHNALGVIRALGERGYEVEFVSHGNLKKNYIAQSKYIAHHIALADVLEIPEYLLNSRTKCQEKKIIISCSDYVTEQLNLNYNRLVDYYIIPGVSKQGKMPELMDKTTMIAMVSKRGIAAPTVWSIPSEIDQVRFPCITKAHISSHGGKFDIAICKDKSQFDTFLANNSDDIFAQAYIDKREEIQFIGCSLNGGDTVIIPGMSKVLRSQPNTNTGFLEYGPIDPFYNDVVEKAKLYIKDCQYSGLFSFEIMRGKDDKIWFLEINFRNDGNAWCVTKAGVNLPVIWVKACMGEDYSSEIKIPNRIVMMPEFQDFKLVLQRKVSLIQWLKDWKRTDYFMEYDKNDSKPFWQFIKDRIK
jgi:predicted ATP-grasp superfamily ATP-dependent carboligase